MLVFNRLILLRGRPDRAVVVVVILVRESDQSQMMMMMVMMDKRDLNMAVARISLKHSSFSLILN